MSTIRLGHSSLNQHETSVEVSVCVGWQARRMDAQRERDPSTLRTARTRWPRRRSPRETPTVRSEKVPVRLILLFLQIVVFPF